MTKTNEVVLDNLAQRINAEHEACRDAANAAVEHAVRAGELLIEAKASIPHGEWLTWIEGRCGVSERTAQAYMRLARELPKLDSEKAQRVADLPLRKALAELAEPKLDGLLESNAEQKLREQGMDKLPHGLSALLSTTRDGEVTVKPEFIFAMAASPKASVQAMITAQILEAALGAEMKPTSLRLPENLPFENWARIGELLMAMPGAEAAIQNAAGQRP